MRLSRAAACLVVLLAGGSALGASYGLRDIVSEALVRNPDLRAAGADLEAAEGRALEGEGLDDFILSARGDFRQDQTELVTGIPVQQPSNRVIGYQLELTKPLPWGGQVGLRGLDNYSRGVFVDRGDDGMGVETTSTNFNPAVLFVLEQPLLRGFGTTAARGLLERSRIDRDAARLNREAVAATVLRDVANAYWELRFAVEVLNLNKQLAQSARDQLEIVEANIKAGKLPPSASAEVLVAAGLRDEQVLLAERAVLERSLELRTLSGLPIGPGETVIEAGDTLESANEIISLETALKRAEESPAVLSARTSGRARAVELDVTENGLLPQLDLSFVAGPIGSADELEDAYAQLGRFDNYTIQAALTFRHPIGRRAARGQTLAARAALHRARINEEDVLAQTRQAVVRLHALTDEARRRLDVIAPTTEAAALDLAAEKARFEVGRATNFDVLRRQEELAQTQLRQARARADLLNARAGLWAATGEILERFGVTVR